MALANQSGMDVVLYVSLVFFTIFDNYWGMSSTLGPIDLCSRFAALKSLQS